MTHPIREPEQRPAPVSAAVGGLPRRPARPSQRWAASQDRRPVLASRALAEVASPSIGSRSCSPRSLLLLGESGRRSDTLRALFGEVGAQEFARELRRL